MEKYHITLKQIIANLLRSFLAITFFGIVSFISAIVDEESDQLIFDWVVAIVFLIIILIALGISAIFIYIINRKQLFYCENDGFVKESGWLFKRRVYVPFKNINTISVKRSLFEIILKISKIEIDTGTTASTKPEFSLCLDKDYALVLKEFLENKKLNDQLVFPIPGDINQQTPKTAVESDDQYFIKAKKSELLKMGLLKEGLLASIISLNLIAVLGFMLYYTFGEPFAETGKMLSLSIVGLIFLGGNIALILLVTLSTLLYYYNYRVIIKDDYLEYQYGLISQTTFRLNRDRINSINVRQSLLYQLTNNYEVELSVLGIGDLSPENQEKDSVESKLVILISKYDKVQELFDILGVDNLNNQPYQVPQKHSKTVFLTIPITFLTIVCLAIIVSTFNYINNNYWLYLPVIISYLIIVFGLFLRKKNHGYCINNTQIKVRHGMYRKSVTYTQFKRIQAIVYTQGIVKLMLGIGNITLNYKDSNGVIKLLNLTSDIAYDLNYQVVNKNNQKH